MTRKRNKKVDQVDLGKPPIVLGLGSGLRDSAGGFCKCGRFSSELDHGLCIYCRAGGTSPVPTPTSIPKNPSTENK